MDVFRFDDDANKSVIAYIDNCQSCGQCYVNCYGRSLIISNQASGYGITANRATTTAYNAAAGAKAGAART
jgi:hypothetical protein